MNYPTGYPAWRRFLDSAWGRGTLVFLGFITIVVLTWPWAWHLWMILLLLVGVLLGVVVLMYVICVIISIVVWVRDGDWENPWGWLPWA